MKNNTKNVTKNKSKALVNPESLKSSELETIKKEIKNTKKTKKLSENNQKKYKKILKNTIIACFIVLYYLALIIGIQNVSVIQFIIDLKVVIMLEAIITVILFETAYKKDEIEYTFYGMEILVVGITTTFLLNLVSKQNDIINIVLATIVICFTLYYLGKILFFSIKRKSRKTNKN